MNVDPARRDAWLAERRTCITSTDLASIMDLEDAYSSPMGVFLGKMNLEPAREELEIFEWGLRLQPPIIEAAADRLGVAVAHADPYELVRLRSRPVIGASLDAMVLTEPSAPLDAKNVGFLKPDQWGPDGSDEIPTRFVVQGHAQMAVTGSTAFYLSALFGGRHLRVYRLERDEEVIAAIYEAAEHFWNTYVVPGVPPPVDGSEEWTRFLGSRAQRTDVLVQATPDLDAWAARLREAREALAQAEAFEAEAKNHLLAAIGDAAGIQGQGWKATFKATKASAKTDWESLARMLGAGPEDIARFTVEKAGYRRFLPTFTTATKRAA